MQNTRYSLGPKFFGTTTKSIEKLMQNPGLMKEIAVPLDLALTKLS